MKINTVPRILLVDDEPLILKSLKEILAVNDYLISTAESGREAIDYLCSDKFDLCILDLIMPGITGHDVMDYIKSRRLDMDVVVLSGDTHIDAAISALSHRASAFIKKPFNPNELLKTVVRALEKKFLVRQKKALNEKIRSSERLHRYLSAHSPDFMYLLDTSGEFIYVNDRVESLLGYRRGELVGKHYSSIVVAEDLGLANRSFDERRTGDRATRNLKIRLQGKNGSVLANAADIGIIPVELNSIGIYSYHEIGTRSQQGSLGIAREVVPTGQQQTGLSFAAYHDALTELPNRLLLHDRLSVALDHAKRRGHLLVVMFIDLDGFKEINDSMGHASGDRVLRIIADRLKDQLRKADTLARYGGDEFILMLPHIDSLDQVEIIAKKVLATINIPVVNMGESVSLSASIGISVFPGDGDTEESLIECADSAMYKVKKQQKDGYHFFSRSESSLSSMPQEEKKIELLNALEFDQFIVFYQPLFDSECEQVIGLEALLRWHHPEKGLIFPSDFLPEARVSGLMPVIDEWVFNRVRKDFTEMLGNGKSGIKLFVNVSVEKFSMPDFGDWLSSVVSDNRSFAKNLYIEIPSDAFSQPEEAIAEKLAGLRKLGIKTVIDFYGGDVSSLAPFYDCGIFGLKIDSASLEESKYSGLNDDSQGFKGSLKQKGMSLIAKNVDSQRHLQSLRSMEFDLVQGFLYYHPLPLQTAKSLIESTKIS